MLIPDRANDDKMLLMAMIEHDANIANILLSTINVQICVCIYI